MEQNSCVTLFHGMELVPTVLHVLNYSSFWAWYLFLMVNKLVHVNVSADEL